MLILAFLFSGAAADAKAPKGHPDVHGLLGGKALTGKVVETMDAGTYTYVRLSTGGGKLWLAVPKMKVKVGRRMSFRPGAEMRDFKSRTLKRTFKSIIFSAGPIRKSAAKDAAEDLKNIHASGPKTAAMDGELKVEKARGPNAYRVAEIYERRKNLDGKKIRVRGKAVKVSNKIMGRNWIHLQDGTGDPKRKTHDLVLTTERTIFVGEIFTFEGVLAKDRDFGRGYKYKAIVEDAVVAAPLKKD